MAKSAKTSANVVANNEVVKSQSTTTTATTQRVVETHEMWAVVFDHTAKLLVMAVKGEAFGKDENEGFAFGKTTDKNGKVQKLASKMQPNIRPYSYSLLAGFASKRLQTRQRHRTCNPRPRRGRKDGFPQPSPFG